MLKVKFSVTRNEFEFMSACTVEADTLEQAKQLLTYTENVQVSNDVLSAVSDCGEFVELFAMTKSAIKRVFWSEIEQRSEDDDEAEDAMQDAVECLNACVD